MSAFPEQPRVLDFAGRAGALAYMGNFTEALEAYTRADELDRAESDYHFGVNAVWCGYKTDLATIHLLLGDLVSAMRELRSDIKGILEWPNCRVDAGGGVTPGLLLWYIAMREADGGVEEEALSYLKRVLHVHRQAKFQMWPRHLADLVLGQTSFAELILDAFGSMNLDELERRAYIERPASPPGEVPKFDPDVPPEGMLLRGYLAQALFYGGIGARRTNPTLGNELLLRCTRLKDVDIENEWYLAFLELGLVDSAKLR